MSSAAPLYADVLGHQADAAGLAFWEGLDRLPFGRAMMAVGFLTSAEASLRMVDSYYANYLGRYADPAGEQGWTSAAQSGVMSRGQIAEGFLAADEYFAHAANSSTP